MEESRFQWQQKSQRCHMSVPHVIQRQLARVRGRRRTLEGVAGSGGGFCPEAAPGGRYLGEGIAERIDATAHPNFWISR